METRPRTQLPTTHRLVMVLVRRLDVGLGHHDPVSRRTSPLIERTVAIQELAFSWGKNQIKRRPRLGESNIHRVATDVGSLNAVGVLRKRCGPVRVIVSGASEG